MAHRTAGAEGSAVPGDTQPLPELDLGIHRNAVICREKKTYFLGADELAELPLKVFILIPFPLEPMTLSPP